MISAVMLCFSSSASRRSSSFVSGSSRMFTSLAPFGIAPSAS